MDQLNPNYADLPIFKSGSQSKYRPSKTSGTFNRPIGTHTLHSSRNFCEAKRDRNFQLLAIKYHSPKNRHYPTKLNHGPFWKPTTAPPLHDK